MEHNDNCYCGSVIRLIGCKRKIKIGESVVVNKTGHEGKVKDCLEGNYVFYYYLVFDEDLDDEFFTGHRYRPWEITPVEDK